MVDILSPTRNLLLGSLPEADYARVAPNLHGVPLTTRVRLLEDGQPMENVYFPNGGVCSLTVTMQDGRVAEVGLVGREGVVGHLVALGQSISNCDAMVQIPDGSAQMMSARDFREELGRGAALHALVNRYAVAASALASTSVACNALHTAEERCARWLLHAHDRVGAPRFELSHEFLAMMLGVRRPTATIVAGILQRAGLIRYRRGHMEILDRERLEEASCECYESIAASFSGLLPRATIPAAGQ